MSVVDSGQAGLPPRLHVTEEPSREPIELVVARVFAPMHKRVLGVAVGATAALVVFAVTAFHVIARPEGPELDRLAVYFYGYDVSWRGAFVGAWWAFVAGFVGGWFAAFVRNFVLAVWLMFVRIRADMQTSRDFLDHI